MSTLNHNSRQNPSFDGSMTGQQARLDRRLALSGWDATQYRYDPVWTMDFIGERDDARTDSLVVRIMGAFVQAPTGAEAELAVAAADLIGFVSKFDEGETTRRLRATGLSEALISAAINFTWLTNGSIFDQDDTRWNLLNEDHEQRYKSMLSRYRLLMDLALHRHVATQMVRPLDASTHSSANARGSK